nr:LamG domain-containing protein [Pirellulaceae bacterium]
MAFIRFGATALFVSIFLSQAALAGEAVEISALGVRPDPCEGVIGQWQSPRTFGLERQTAAFGKLTAFSVSLWIRPESPAAASQLLFAFSDSTADHRIQMEVHQGRLHFGWQNDGGFAGFGTDQLRWTPGTWYHVVFINDHKSGKTILRSNDAVWKRDANTLAPAELKSPVTRVSIGSLNGAYVFNGVVKNVQLFGRALTAAEQSALYDSGRVAILAQEQREADRARLVRQFQEHEAPRLPAAERQRKLEWLFQLEDDDPLTRANKEIGWTRAIIE